MAAESNRQHQEQAAGVNDSGKYECIGAARGISAEKIAGAPDEDRA